MDREQALAALKRTDDALAEKFCEAETEDDLHRMEMIRRRRVEILLRAQEQGFDHRDDRWVDLRPSKNDDGLTRPERELAAVNDRLDDLRARLRKAQRTGGAIEVDAARRELHGYIAEQKRAGFSLSMYFNRDGITSSDPTPANSLPMDWSRRSSSQHACQVRTAYLRGCEQLYAEPATQVSNDERPTLDDLLRAVRCRPEPLASA